MSLKAKNITLAIASMAAFTCAANAATVEVTLDSVTPGGAYQVSIDGGGSFMLAGGGGFNWTRTGGDHPGPGAVGQFTSFCIEVTEMIAVGDSYTYDIVALEDAPDSLGGMGASDADLLSELFGRFYNDSFTDAEAQAFQAAIWNIVYDTDTVVDGGDFQIAIAKDITQDILDDANALLGALDGSGPRLDLGGMTAQGIQDQVYIIPAPGAIALLGLAGAMTGRRRRRA